MTSPPQNQTNILQNPFPELLQAIRENRFGIKGYRMMNEAPYAFPITSNDITSVREESNATGRMSSRVFAKVWLETLEGREIWVVLDWRGYTVDEPNGTSYESLEALLIAISPGYNEAMSVEVTRRLEALLRDRE